MFSSWILIIWGLVTFVYDVRYDLAWCFCMWMYVFPSPFMSKLSCLWSGLGTSVKEHLTVPLSIQVLWSGCVFTSAPHSLGYLIVTMCFEILMCEPSNPVLHFSKLFRLFCKTPFYATIVQNQVFPASRLVTVLFPPSV